MRILFSHRIQSRDGQAVHIEALVAAFRSQGHEVLVVGPRTYDRADFGGEGRGLAVFRRLCPAVGYELLELAYNIPSIWRLLRACRKFRPDFVYERYNLFFFGGLALKWCFGVPFHLEINAPLAEERATHDGLSLKRLALFLERHVWRQAEHTYPVTSVLADYVVRAGVDADRITVNQNGVDLAEYPIPPRGRPAPGETITLGFIGFLKNWHGIDGVISLLASAADLPNLRLVIGGDGPARRDLEQQVTELGLRDKVEFLGLVPRHRLVEVISGFDIALQPKAVPYASPLKLFEYMALGRAIVAPEQPNICEILTDERNALLFEPDNPVSLRRAVARLATDAGLRDALGATARRDLADRDYTWGGNARRIVDACLRDLAARKTGTVALPDQHQSGKRMMAASLLYSSGAPRQPRRRKRTFLARFLVRFLGVALVLANFHAGPAHGETPTRLPRDPKAAVGNSAFDLAVRYENGEAVRRDYTRARALYCEAARDDDPRAWLALGWLFMNARGVPRDDHAAAFWLRKAAAQKVPQAINLLDVLGGVTPIERGCSSPVLMADRVYGPSKAPIPPEAYREAIEQTAQDVGVSPRLLTSMVAVESAYDARAVSPKGAVGLMQLMPATAERFHVRDALDYRENLRGGAAYIRLLLEKFDGDVGLALAAYNAGEGRVLSYRGVPPFAETQAYVRIVTQLCGCAGALTPPATPRGAAKVS